MPGAGIRSLVAAISHRPLQQDNAAKYLFGLGVAFDLVLQKVDEGVHGHFVFDADESFLAFIGRDRLVARGLSEAVGSYRVRLQRALDDLQHAGTPWAVMGQVLGYVLSSTPAMLTVSSNYSSTGANTSSVWNYYTAGEDAALPPKHLFDSSGNFDWDSLSPTSGSWGHWRWYFVIQSVAPNDWIGPADFVIGDSDPKIGTSQTWSVGFNRPKAVITSIRIIVRQFKANICHWMIVSFDASLFDPASPVGGGINPDGYFGLGWKVVSRHHVASRFAAARYCTGV